MNLTYKIIASYDKHTLRSSDNNEYNIRILSFESSIFVRHEAMIYNKGKLIFEERFTSLENAKNAIDNFLKNTKC